MNAKDKKFLENRKVILKPIIKPGSPFGKGHDGEFMYTGSVIQFVLPYNIKKGRLENILTAEEQEYFEEKLDADLNIHKKVDNFWHTFAITIRKDTKLMDNGYELDLSDPVDNLKYRLLKIQPAVAPNWASRFKRGEYRFALVDDSELVEEKAMNADLKKKAYMFLGKVETSKKKMTDFLRVYGKTPPDDASLDYLKSEIDAIIEDKKELKKLLKIIEDPNYEMKLFIEDALDCGAITKKQGKYYLPGGDLINPSDPRLDGTVSMLNKYKKEADDIFLIMEERVRNCK
jgi:hypothetical protein